MPVLTQVLSQVFNWFSLLSLHSHSLCLHVVVIESFRLKSLPDKNDSPLSHWASNFHTVSVTPCALQELNVLKL